MRLSPLAATAGALIVASLLCSALLYDRLPDPVPTHFDLAGNANGFTPKPLGAFTMPIVLAFVGAILVAIPRISPRGYMINFPRAYTAIAIAILAFVFCVGMVAMFGALGYRVGIGRGVFAGLGALFIVMGNYMGKMTRNFFVGIRTPWTLASDEVWLRTHRVGGVLFVLTGISAIVISAVSTRPEVPVIAILVGVSLFLVVYSYVLYRRIEGP